MGILSWKWRWSRPQPAPLSPPALPDQMGISLPGTSYLTGSWLFLMGVEPPPGFTSKRAQSICLFLGVPPNYSLNRSWLDLLEKQQYVCFWRPRMASRCGLPPIPFTVLNGGHSEEPGTSSTHQDRGSTEEQKTHTLSYIYISYIIE